MIQNEYISVAEIINTCFQMSIKIIFTFIISAIILGIIPGPSVCFSIAHSLKFGSIKTAPFIFGQMTANTL